MIFDRDLMRLIFPLTLALVAGSFHLTFDEIESSFKKLDTLLTAKKPAKAKKVVKEKSHYDSKYYHLLTEGQRTFYMSYMMLELKTFEQMDRIVEEEGWLNHSLQVQ